MNKCNGGFSYHFGSVTSVLYFKFCNKYSSSLESFCDSGVILYVVGHFVHWFHEIILKKKIKCLHSVIVWKEKLHVSSQISLH